MKLWLMKKNIRMNLKNYFFYLFAIAVNAMMFYLFYSLSQNDVIGTFMHARDSTRQMFYVTSGIIGLFSLVFILYATAYFVRRRGKEIGLYMMLGLNKGAIAGQLILEYFVIGLLAIVLGLGLGVTLSKLMIMGLLQFLGMEHFVGFSIAWQPLLVTLGLYLAILGVSGVITGGLVMKFNIKKFFILSKKEEKPFKTKSFMAFASVFLLLFGYGVALIGARNINSLGWTILTVVSTSIIGTFLFFRHFFARLLQAYRKKGNGYYKGLKMIWLSHFTFRIREHRRLLSIIAIISAVSLTAVGISNGIYVQTTAIQEESAYYDLQYYPDQVTQEEDLEKALRQLQEGIILDETFEVIELKGNRYFQEADKDRLTRPGITSFEVGKVYNHLADEGYPLLNEDYEYQEVIVSQDDFNELAKQEPLREIRVLKVDEMATYLYQLAEAGYYVYPEEMDYYLYARNLSMLVEMKLLVFIAIFVGLIFILSAGSILYFKQVTMVREDRLLYQRLRELGMSPAEQSRVIQAEAGLLFGMPLVLGSLHSLVAMLMLRVLLVTNAAKYFEIQGILFTTLKVFALYYCLYLGIYLVTMKKSTGLAVDKQSMRTLQF